MNFEIRSKIRDLNSSVSDIMMYNKYKSFPEYNIDLEDHKKAIEVLNSLIEHIETNFAENQFMEDLTIKMLDAAIKITKGDFDNISEEEHKALKRGIVSLESFHNKFNSSFAPFIRDSARCFFNKLNPVYLKGCYVATCVYGSYDCPQVWTLRRYRDFSLAKTWYGRTFVKIYYTISPMLVKWFGNTNWFKKIWKNTLDHIVTSLESKGFESTPYED